MKRATAHGGGLRGHPEFEIDIGDCDPEMADGLIDYLEQRVGSDGVDFKAGDLIQYGSAVFRVAVLSDGRLTLLEPEHGTSPMHWVPSVAEALSATIRQVHAADSVGLSDQIDFPHPFRLGYMCKAVTPGQALIFSRHAKVGADEGWSVLCTDPEHDHDDPSTMTSRELHEIAAEIPEFWLFAAFPVGASVWLQPGYPPRIRLRGREVMIQIGSFLDKLFEVWL